MLVKVSLRRSIRRDDILHSVQEGTCPAKGFDRINGAIARISDGPVFGPAILELSELPCTDSSRMQRTVLGIYHLLLFISHALTDRLEKHS
jgi:hypothetical protein